VAKLSDLERKYESFMEAYAYRSVDWRPGTVLKKPLSQARVAVITTAGYYRPDQAPFDASIPGGDYSYRPMPIDTDLTTLRIGHKSDAFDASGIAADRNLALPLDRLRALAQEGVIGSIASLHFSFMGSITSPSRLITVTAPEVAAILRLDEVDAVLLTPV
jgi:D-proline reductase (dithiol) PrdB